MQPFLEIFYLVFSSFHFKEKKILKMKNERNKVLLAN